MTAHCPRCHGHGSVTGLDDCQRCDGTGWADRQERATCDACGRLALLTDMHVSPDHDGHRTVCEPCCRRLDREEER